MQPCAQNESIENGEVPKREHTTIMTRKEKVITTQKIKVRAPGVSFDGESHWMAIPNCNEVQEGLLL